MRLESVGAAERALYAYVPKPARKQRYSLDRISGFLKAIGDPQERVRVVHVAGTSGKTSTAYFSRALIQRAGHSTGLTVSPHMVSITERVQVDGRPLPDREFCSRLGDFLELVEGHRERLSYFEVLVAFAYRVFADTGVEYAVVETGLGGLLDGTNTVRRRDKLCLISDIGRDHTEILGDTIEEIAAQKAGIVQPGNHVVVIDQDPAALDVILAYADKQGATSQVVQPVQDPDLPPFQRRNWALARAGFEHLQLGAPDEGAKTAQPPGRLEKVEIRGRQVLLDGAHNPQKLAALHEALGPDKPAVLAGLIEAPESKLDAAFEELATMAGHLIVCEFAVAQDLPKRSPSAAELAARARKAGIEHVEAYDRVEDALAALLRREEKTLLVTGSLYLVSQVRALV